MRSHYCSEINASLIDVEVTLCGWVDRCRDHGGLIFIDLRERDTIVQVIFDPDNQSTFTQAQALRNEYVIQVTGKVRHRPAGTVNKELSSGEVEVIAAGKSGVVDGGMLPDEEGADFGEGARILEVERVADGRREVIEVVIALEHGAMAALECPVRLL